VTWTIASVAENKLFSNREGRTSDVSM
jgi:hypothetical protein